MSAEREGLRERIARILEWCDVDDLGGGEDESVGWESVDGEERDIPLTFGDVRWLKAHLLALLGEREEPAPVCTRCATEAALPLVCSNSWCNEPAQWFEPAGRAQESEREHLTERAFDLADGLSDALWGGERGWEGRSAEQTLRVLRERLRASEPAEAETYTLEEIMDMLRPEHPDAVKALRRRAESREGEER